MYYPGRFDAVGLIADIAVWLTIITATGVVVEHWTRKVEQGTPIRPAPFLAATVVGNVVCLFTLSNPGDFPEWYDYLSWLFGIAFAAFAIEVAIFRRGVALLEIPRMDKMMPYANGLTTLTESYCVPDERSSLYSV